MKKLLTILVLVMAPFVGAPAAHAANWTQQVQAAINSGNFSQIDVIAAKNPEDEGDIAMYLLQQSQNGALNQDVRVKLFEAVAPFGSQIAATDAPQAAILIRDMLNLANNSAFQKDHHKGAARIIAVALSLSDQPNLLASDSGLHEEALADAGNFPGAGDDKDLTDQVDLALEIGLSPPVGPRGIINPSVE